MSPLADTAIHACPARVPAPSPGTLARRRALASLEAARTSPVTTVVAPAGWGKTTTLAMWARTRALAGRVAWLSVPVGEPSTPSWLVDAITARLAAAEGGQTPRVRVVVVDDAHRLPDTASGPGAREAVERFGGRLRFVFAGRTEPAGLDDWQLAGAYTRLDPAALALDIGEVRLLLDMANVDLTDAATLQLHALTQGWPAGLDLVIRMLRHAGPHRCVVDDVVTYGPAVRYVEAEIVDALPPQLRDVLRCAAVVGQVSPALLRALTAGTDGAGPLAELHERTGFVARLPGDGDWYGCHPLVSGVLRRQLQDDDPGRVTRLHAAASRWFASFGLPTEALRHALVSGDQRLAETVFRTSWPDIVAGLRRHSPLGRPAAGHTYPLVLVSAAERLEAGDLEGMRQELRRADATGRPDADGDLAPARNALHAAAASATGDAAAVRAITAATSTARPAPASAVPGLVALGAASLLAGDLGPARSSLHAALLAAQHHELVQAQITAASYLAALEAARGRLHAATRSARMAETLADRHGVTSAGALAWARLALAETYYQRNELDRAAALVEQALDEAHEHAPALTLAALTRARVRAAAGEDTGPLIRLTGGQEVLDPALPASIRRVLLLTNAELQLGAGNPALARQLVESWHDGTPCESWATVVNGALLLTEGRPEAAATAVDPYLDPVASPSLTLTIYAGIVFALAGQQLNDRTRILRGLEVSLAIAEDEGHRWAFVTAGPRMRDLVERYGPGMPVYRPIINELIRLEPRPPNTPPRARRGSAPGLVEPLTERELTVLRHLQDTLSNVEIATILAVSVNTVKTHVKNIYRKLQAGRRREAVQRARQLRLL